MIKVFCGGFFFLVIIVHIFNTRGRNLGKNRKLKKTGLSTVLDEETAGVKSLYWRKEFFLLYMRKHFSSTLLHLSLLRFHCVGGGWHFTLRPNSWTKSRQKSEVFTSSLFKVTSTALPGNFYVFKLTQPLTVSTVHYCTL
jgi:hypothetical protein